MLAYVWSAAGRLKSGESPRAKKPNIEKADLNRKEIRLNFSRKSAFKIEQRHVTRRHALATKAAPPAFRHPRNEINFPRLQLSSNYGSSFSNAVISCGSPYHSRFVIPTETERIGTPFLVYS